MMQLTGQNRFTRTLSGSYKMTNGSRTGEAIKESIVRESTELAVDARIEDGESMVMPNEKQCHV